MSSPSSWPTAIRRLSGLNLAADSTRARVGHGDGLPVDVPDRQDTAGMDHSRDVAAVGAEAEHGDGATARGREASNHRIIADAADLDRVAEMKRIAGHGGVENGRQGPRGPMDDPSGLL